MMNPRTKAILGLSATFLVGALCGALVLGLVVRERVREAEELRSGQKAFVGLFERRLALTEAQRDSLADELEWLYGRVTELRRQTAADYNGLIDTFKLRVYPKLTAEQRTLFERQEQRLRSHVPPRGPRRGGRPAPPPGVAPPPAEMAPPMDAPDIIAPPRSRRGDTAAVGGRQGARPILPPEGTSAADEGPRALERMIPLLRDSLALSEDQVARMREIVSEARTRAETARRELADEPMRRRQAVARIASTARRDLMALLTPEQRERFRQMRQRHRAPRGPGD